MGRRNTNGSMPRDSGLTTVPARGVVRMLGAAIVGAGVWSSTTAASALQASSPEAQAAPASDSAPQEIMVTARRRGARSDIDRTVFDIAASDDAASLNMVDILRRLPGISVAPSGTITVRGGADVGFLVDGKLVRRELALAIPASQIDRVEVITTPPAEYASDYDALLNIVLKTSADLGWTGTGSGKVDTQGGYRAGTSVSYGGTDTSANASLSLRSMPSIVDTTRNTVFTDPAQSPRLLPSQRIRISERSTFRQFSGQAKVTHQFAERESLDLVASASYNVNPHDDRIVESGNGAAGGPEDVAYRRIIGFQGFYPSGSLTYRKRGADHDWTIGIEGNGGRSDETRTFAGGVSKSLADRLSYHFVQLTSDYETSLSDGRKLTIGGSLATNGVVDDLRLSGFRGAGRDQAIGFGFNRRSFAAYVAAEGTVAGFGIKPGLRVEGFTQGLTLAGRSAAGFGGTTRLLPSLHLTRKVGADQTLKGGFSIRLEKPDALNFNPALKFNSAVQADQGNPDLRPVRKIQAEIGYVVEKKRLFVETSAYARKAIAAVNTVQYLLDGGVTVTSFVNLGQSETLGASVDVRWTPDRKLEIAGGIDLFHQRIVAPAALDVLGTAAFLGLNGNMTVNYAPDKRNSFLVNVTYTGRNETLGIVNPATGSTDFQYTRALPHKVSLTLNLVDAGVRQSLSTRFQGPGIVSVERVRRASRLVRIGLSKPF